MSVDDDKKREERIYSEAIVDCYGEYEVAAGWYYYLEDRLSFPFKAKCTVQRSISPLKVGETVEVIGMPSQNDSLHEILVLIRLMDRTFGVPLEQLQPLEADETTIEAAGDWRYWKRKGYEF